nr:Fe-S protein assembly co-chaperone HscB [Curvibacter sp. CHRR-16]
MQDNDFTLLGVPKRFALDAMVLDQQWKSLLRQIHPDKFATDSSIAQRLSMQWSVRVNEAYQRLKSPLKRACYMCELAGVPIQAESNTSMPAHFLMQQMQWREDLDGASTSGDLENLLADVLAAQKECEATVSNALDHEPAQPLLAAQTVRAWMFVDKFRQDVLRRINTL